MFYTFAVIMYTSKYVTGVSVTGEIQLRRRKLTRTSYMIYADQIDRLRELSATSLVPISAMLRLGTDMYLTKNAQALVQNGASKTGASDLGDLLA